MAPPTEATLQYPKLNTRLGAAYLARLVEKFDNSRARLRRSIECRARDADLGQDPYRTQIGMSETAFGAALLGALLPPVEAMLGITGGTFLLVDTLAFAVVAVAFLAAFTIVIWLTHRLADPDRRDSRTSVGTYAATLLPIAAGYLIAHYLTLVIQGAVWLPSLIVDPMTTLRAD